MVSRHFLKVMSGESYQPCLPSLRHCALKSKIVEKYPFSPINLLSSDLFKLKASATVNASYFSNVFFFKSSNNSPIPSTLSIMRQHPDKPSGPSGPKSGKSRSFLIFIIASILNPARPFSSHQFTISKSFCLRIGFSQFKSGCSFANICK